MSTLMEFWGVEVKSGQSLKINPGDNKIVHLSQACLGEIKKDKGSESVYLYLKVDDKKLVIGTLSGQKYPQLSFDLVIEKDFELSHNWENGSVYFTGYKLRTDGTDDDDDNSDSDEDVKDIQLVGNGKPELQAKPVSEKPIAVKSSGSTAKQNMKDVKPKQKADDSDSDDSDLNTSSSDDDETSDDENPNLVNRESSSDESSGELDESNDKEDDEGTDESDDEEETPKKSESSKKRPVESASNVAGKKAKFITPQKTEGRKGVSHIATPHPSKKSGKTSANSDQTKQQPHKSGRSFHCKSCNRSFTTDGGLQSHTKAKHSAPA